MAKNPLTGHAPAPRFDQNQWGTFAFSIPFRARLPLGKGKTMSVIRTSLLVLAIAVMLPSPPETHEPKLTKQNNAPTATLVGTAIDSVVDLEPICAGQETVCVTAGYLLGRLEAKALYNIGLLYGWAKSDLAGTVSPLANQANADPIFTGSATKLSGPKNTLRLDDLIPAWRGPRSSKS
jgi:hypothetical protein